MGLNKRLINQEGVSAPVNTEHFNMITYTGNRNSRSFSTGFAPDLVWIKNRNQGDQHMLFDSVRGATKFVSSNVNTSEGTSATSLTSFNSDGFSLGAYDGRTNELVDYIAWCFKGGGTAVSNTDGGITSSVSANTDAGFSIVKWTGTGSANSIGHGLDDAPQFIFARALTKNYLWFATNTEALASQGYWRFAGYPAFGELVGGVWSGYPTSSVMNVTGDASLNRSGDSYIAYCFHSVDGYSKVSTYTGNGGTNTISGLGFQPRFVYFRRKDGGNFLMYQSVTSGKYLKSDTGDAQATDGTSFVFQSDGFQMNTSDNNYNANGDEYAYLAIA